MGRSTRRQFTPQQKYEVVMQLVRGEKRFCHGAHERPGLLWMRRVSDQCARARR